MPWALFREAALGILSANDAAQLPVDTLPLLLDEQISERLREF